MFKKGSQLSLPKYFRVVFQRKWLIITPIILGVLIATVYALRIEDRYRASRSYALTQERSDLLTSLAPQSNQRNLYMKTLDKFTSERNLCEMVLRLSRTEIENHPGVMYINMKTTDRAELEARDSDGVLKNAEIKTWAGRLRGALSIEMSSRIPYMIRFVIEDTEKKNLDLLVTAISAEFRNMYLDVAKEEFDSTNKFLQTERVGLQKQLDDKLTEGEKFVKNYVFIPKVEAKEGKPGETIDFDILSRKSGLLKKFYTSIGVAPDSAESDRLSMNKDILTAEIKNIEKQLDEFQQSSTKAVLLEQDRIKIAQTQKELAPVRKEIAQIDAMLKKWAYNPPEVAKLQAQRKPHADKLALLETTLAELEKKNKATEEERQKWLAKKVELEPQLAAKKAELAKVELSLKVAYENVQYFPKQVTEFERIRSEIQNIVNGLLELDRKIRQIEMAKKLDWTKLEPRDKAKPPGDPVYPNRIYLIMIGLLVGTLVSAFSVLTVEYFDHSIKNVEDLEEGFGLKVLGVIPETEFWKHRPPHHHHKDTADKKDATAAPSPGEKKIKAVLMWWLPLVFALTSEAALGWLSGSFIGSIW